MAISIWKKAILILLVSSIVFLVSIIDKSKSSSLDNWDFFLFTKLFLTIKRFAMGLPRKEPAISPNVAAVRATVRASGYPSASILGATAADVPWPPVNAGEAVSSASKTNS